MKFRNILPVVLLSVLVLAFAVAYSSDAADAQTINVAASQSDNQNVNQNENKVDVSVNVSFDPSDLAYSSTWTMTVTKERWYNDSIVKDGAFKHSVGVVQPAIVSGSNNSVRQATLAIYFDNNQITVGDTTTTNL